MTILGLSIDSYCSSRFDTLDGTYDLNVHQLSHFRFNLINPSDIQIQKLKAAIRLYSIMAKYIVSHHNIGTFVNGYIILVSRLTKPSIISKFGSLELMPSYFEPKLNVRLEPVNPYSLFETFIYPSKKTIIAYSHGLYHPAGVRAIKALTDIQIKYAKRTGLKRNLDEIESISPYEPIKKINIMKDSWLMLNGCTENIIWVNSDRDKNRMMKLRDFMHRQMGYIIVQWNNLMAKETLVNFNQILVLTEKIYGNRILLTQMLDTLIKYFIDKRIVILAPSVLPDSFDVSIRDHIFFYNLVDA